MMDVSSQDGPTKRPRSKTASKAAGPRKTLTTRKKAATIDVPSAAPVVVEMTPDPPQDLNSMIATAAFYLAADRDFTPGRELDDWLEAERRVLAAYG